MQKIVIHGCVAGNVTSVLGIGRGRVSFPADLTC